jgi:hypothetical protein
MPEDLCQIAPATTENEKIAAMGIALQALLNLQGQSLQTPAHIRVARRDPDPHAARKRDHERSAFKVAAINADGAPAPIRTRASFTSTTMTPGSPATGGETDNAGDPSISTGANPEVLAPADRLAVSIRGRPPFQNLRERQCYAAKSAL